MKKNQRIVTASVTVIAAAATAHLMQRNSADVPRTAPVAPAGASVLATPATPAPDLGPAQAQNPVIVVAKPESALPEPTEAAAGPVVETVAADITGEAPGEIIVASVEPVAAPAAEPPRRMAADDLAEAAPGVMVAAAVTGTETVTDASVAEPGLVYPGMPVVPSEALMPSPFPSPDPDLRTRMAMVAAEHVEPVEPVEPVETAEIAEPEIKRNELGLSCGAFLTAMPKGAAMVGLTLTDPCRGGETISVEHGALTFTARLDPFGTYKTDVPALMQRALFTVQLQGGGKVATEIDVPSVDQVDRVALFTDGQSGLAIHALEFGDDYGDAGHVWSDNARDAETAARTGGGFLTVLGDASLPEARLAEIYTFPADTPRRDGVVRLSIEAEVTAYNCGKDVSGQSLQKQAGSDAAPVSLTLAMPGCDAIGEFLVLKNLLRDLKIASN